MNFLLHLYHKLTSQSNQALGKLNFLFISLLYSLDKFEGYQNLIVFLVGFKADVKISPSSISNLKARGSVVRTVIINDDVIEFCGYVHRHLPHFDLTLLGIRDDGLLSTMFKGGLSPESYSNSDSDSESVSKIYARLDVNRTIEMYKNKPLEMYKNKALELYKNKPLGLIVPLHTIVDDDGGISTMDLGF